ncbi:MAG: hypothetical protein M3256_07460 [Actinomycetota bacterium]|nr:hypothetical protein [Actinomycetota bacterium]
MLSLCCRLTDPRRGGKGNESGIVAVNLALTIAFALFAVIELSRVTLAAKQIKQRVRTITTEVGPGSNVSRLDETKILDTVADRANQILAAAKPLSGQANDILTQTKSIDATGSQILTNAQEINGTVKSINGTFQSLAPVVNNIRGQGGGTPDSPTPAPIGGVNAINVRVDNILGSVTGIRSDLDQVRTDVGPGPGSIDFHAGNIDAFANNPLGNPVGVVKSLLCSALGICL